VGIGNTKDERIPTRPAPAGFFVPNGPPSEMPTEDAAVASLLGVLGDAGEALADGHSRNLTKT